MAYAAANTENPYGQRPQRLGSYTRAPFVLPTQSPRYSFGPIPGGTGLGAIPSTTSLLLWGAVLLGAGMAFGFIPVPRVLRRR